MTTIGSNFTPGRRKILLRDSVIFSTLALATVALYGLTSLLFSSFSAHRNDLAKRWSERGKLALSQGHPEQAVTSLRAALSYAPDERSYQLLLAESLADAGHTEEASNYFLNLWELQPGDGFINLELARLARRKRSSQEAVEYYRASIFGSWQGDGVARRREVRLELADYLIERGDLAAARAELLIAASNAPEDARLDLLFGDKLQQAGDGTDALNSYQKAIAVDPRNRAALEKAGRLTYTAGDYPAAERLLSRALQERPTGAQDRNDQSEIALLRQLAGRLPELSFSRTLPNQDRAAHLVSAVAIARRRFESCEAQAGKASVPLPPPMQDLKLRWKTARASSNLKALEQNASDQESVRQLIYDTEIETSRSCGPPTGDDELLLSLAKSPAKADR